MKGKEIEQMKQQHVLHDIEWETGQIFFGNL
jgi:hypothetical protein